MSDDECKCICHMHRNITEIICDMTAVTSIIVTGRVIGDVPIAMCKPCAVWWLETQLDVRQGEPL